ncbi:hypothetical protein HPP92_002728 [Vanilla planifolia]|uniref:Uncharacterized protein n=1 Tax=Vanilla planifolia TaxID=51239 RepID=A0A835VGJ5_VANPL|nr:hypothetical protein HPP92_002728 [Vanilla planifolia]
MRKFLDELFHDIAGINGGARKVKKKRSIEEEKVRLNSIPHDLIVELTAVLGAAGVARKDGWSDVRRRFCCRVCRWNSPQAEIETISPCFKTTLEQPGAMHLESLDLHPLQEELCLPSASC